MLDDVNGNKVVDLYFNISVLFYFNSFAFSCNLSTSLNFVIDVGYPTSEHSAYLQLS